MVPDPPEQILDLHGAIEHQRAKTVGTQGQFSWDSSMSSEASIENTYG